jgi:hypothetical protein
MAVGIVQRIAADVPITAGVVNHQVGAVHVGDEAVVPRSKDPVLL